jgi:hypothetical protein
MAPSSLSTNHLCTFRGGPGGERRHRARGKARRGHHLSCADLALAWSISRYRDAHAFDYASGSHSMAQVMRGYHKRARGDEQK